MFARRFAQLSLHAFLQHSIGLPCTKAATLRFFGLLYMLRTRENNKSYARLALRRGKFSLNWFMSLCIVSLFLRHEGWVSRLTPLLYFWLSTTTLLSMLLCGFSSVLSSLLGRSPSLVWSLRWFFGIQCDRDSFAVILSQSLRRERNEDRNCERRCAIPSSHPFFRHQQQHIIVVYSGRWEGTLPRTMIHLSTGTFVTAIDQIGCEGSASLFNINWPYRLVRMGRLWKDE